MRKTLIVGLAAALLLALAPSAMAAPAVPTGTLTMSTTLRLGGGTTYGSPVAFDATYNGVRRQDPVRVQVLCMQGGSVVFGDNVVLSSSPSTAAFVLGQPTANGTSVWAGGAASCRSDLYVIGAGGRVTFLAAVTFEAA